MKLIEQSCLNILGFLVTLENFVVVLAAIRTKSLLENTHYNLVISLSVCDFILGIDVILYGNVIVPNNDANNEDIYTVCAVHFYVNSATYHMTLVQTFFISLNRYLVITESKLNDLLWNGKRKYIVFCVVRVVLFILNSSILIVFCTSWLQYKLYTWQRNICSYVWFSSSPNSKSDDHSLRCNFVEDIQGTQKDGLQHGGDR